VTARAALLALEDGTVFRGVALGAPGTATGEVCFNTGMTGYQEILTDPSYHRQIVTMTAPHVGNTGTNEHDHQSRRPWVAGFVVREACERWSSWRGQVSLDDYLMRHRVPAIAGLDTRRLTRHIRRRGAMSGALSSEVIDPDELVDRARASASYAGVDLVHEVTTPAPYAWGRERLEDRVRHGYVAGAERAPATRALVPSRSGARRRRVAALDFGIKRNTLDLLVAGGCDVTVLPGTASARDVLSAGFEGVFLSNGPGDPEPVRYAIETVRALLGRVPIFGICLGHQILALALGARTYKLPFGHRGGNHPVRRLGHARVEITCQNHGFAVDQRSLAATEAALTHVNLNDGTVEGLEVAGVAFGVQYHPEAGPGPHDARYLFERFQELIERFEPAGEAASRARSISGGCVEDDRKEDTWDEGIDGPCGGRRAGSARSASASGARPRPGAPNDAADSASQGRR
jgi:carbamoyl-phosphate synthase small subunit